MKLYIKYMVSLRCKMLVKEELKKLGIDCVSVDLGVAEIQGDITDEQLKTFANNLKKSGLELLEDKKNFLVKKIKSVIVEMIHYEDVVPKVNYSDYISEKLGYDYTYLSNTFSEVMGVTIQRYIILHKIERAKELLLYEEPTLTEIAYKLNYSSVAHLSNQFKKITGLTPTYFKELKEKREEKTSATDKFMQIIDGKEELIIDGKSNLLETGQSIMIPAHTRHSFKANDRFKMISTTIKSGYEDVS